MLFGDPEFRPDRLSVEELDELEAGRFGESDFSEAQFLGDADFSSAHFSTRVAFNNALFSGDAHGGSNRTETHANHIRRTCRLPRTAQACPSCVTPRHSAPGDTDPSTGPMCPNGPRAAKFRKLAVSC